MNTTDNTDTTLARQQFDAALLELKKSLPKGIQVEVYWSKGLPIISYRVRYMRMGKRHDLGTYYIKDEALRALASHKVYGTVNQIPTTQQQVAFNSVESTVAMAALALGEHKTAEVTKAVSSHLSANVSTSPVNAALELEKAKAVEIMEAALQVYPPHIFTGEKDIDFYWEEKDELIVITPMIVRLYFSTIEEAARKEAAKERQAAMLRGPEDRSDSQESPDPNNSNEEEQPELSDEEYNRMLGLGDD